MPDPPQLLVTPRMTPTLQRALERHLPKIGVLVPGEAGEGPWPSVQAALVGAPQREMPMISPETVPGIRFVQRLFTGMDRFPFHRFPPGCEFAGNVGAYAVPVAEHGLMLVLALAKGLRTDQEAILARERARPQRRLILEGKEALLVGYGEIARALAQRLKGLGMRVVGMNRTGAPAPGADQMVTPAERLSAIARADVVVDLLPLTRATRGFFGAPELEALKPDAIFVNLGRGGTVSPSAMAELLRRRPESRIGLEVWWDERSGRIGEVEPGLGLEGHPYALGTPHVAGLAEGALERAEELAVENLARFFRGERPLHRVDPRDYEEVD
jgi:D-3-phosphoglycerate dehydrogenase